MTKKSTKKMTEKTFTIDELRKRALVRADKAAKSYRHAKEYFAVIREVAQKAEELGDVDGLDSLDTTVSMWDSNKKLAKIIFGEDEEAIVDMFDDDMVEISSFLADVVSNPQIKKS